MKYILRKMVAIASVMVLILTGCPSPSDPPLPKPTEVDTAVNIAAIQGVTAPVTGGIPVTAITPTAQYSGTVIWNGNPSTFAANTQYTATITLTAKTGYTLQGVAANFFTVAGAVLASNNANSGVITAVFPQTGGTAPATDETTANPTVSVTGVSLNKSSTTLLVGAIETLTPAITPANAANKNITWSSSNNSVATVSAGGVVTAVAVGTATITVTTVDGGKTAFCTVTVSPIAVTGVSLNKPSTSILVNHTETLFAIVHPDNATNQNVTWSSSNTAVATVSAGGVVTAVAAGTATITVSTVDGGKTTSCTVTVSNVVVDVTGVSLNKSTAGLVVGTTEDLTATIIPASATNQIVTWSSNDTNVATVSAGGVVTAKNVGTATITVTTDDGGRTASCTVTVNPKAITLTVDPIWEQTYTGSPIQPTVTVRDSSTVLTLYTDYTMSYSSNTNAGTATVTVSGAGNYAGSSGSRTFTINPKVTTFTVDAIPAQTYTGSEIRPTVTVKDGSTVLALTTDYTVAYTNNTNAGTATVTVTGAGNYAGSSGSRTFTINPKAITLTVDSIPVQTYTGSEIKPAVIVKDGSTTLALTTDYTVSYTNNTNAGTAIVTISGAGNYAGSTGSAAFTILQTVSPDRIEYYWVNQNGSLVTTSGGAVTVAAGATLTITAQSAGYTVKQWHLDGKDTGQSGNTYNFSSITTGKHTVGLFVEKDGKLYNTNIIITVQ